MFSPKDFGAPAFYTAWRAGQAEGVMQALISPRRFIVLDWPTGMGKSLGAAVVAKALDGRTVYLTQDLGLQDQVEGDFREMNLEGVKGMGNYICDMEGVTRGTPCSDGPCLIGVECPLREGGCRYFDRHRAAKLASFASTNYAWWFTHKGDLGSRSVLIADEAHAIGEAISRFMKVELSLDEMREWRVSPGWQKWNLQDWITWAAGISVTLDALLLDRNLEPGRRLELRDLQRRLVTLRGAKGDWFISHPQNGFLDGVSLEPLWAKDYAEDLLFKGIQKVILASATIVPQDLVDLGIDLKEVEWVKAASPIPAARRPIVHVPGQRLSEALSEEQWLGWVEAVDGILDHHADVRVLLHSGSYKRALFLHNNSRHSKRIVRPAKDTTRATVEAFRTGPVDGVLLSPALVTGWNFPDCDAEVQIIGKVPFPPPIGVTAAREELAPGYGQRAALKQIVQATGRCARKPTDSCITYICDDHIVWLVSKHKKTIIPGWWMEAYRSLPKGSALPRLEKLNC